jgi:hypothetical protein
MLVGAVEALQPRAALVDAAKELKPRGALGIGGAAPEHEALGELELELELTLIQMTKKPFLRAEEECACVAQMARAKFRRRGW